MRAILLSAAAVVLTAGCGGGTVTGAGGSSETTAPPPTQTTAPPSAEPAGTGRVIQTAHSDYGTMLFDRSGQAIYLFDKETSRTPRCYGACARAWPPVLTRGLPQAAGDVREPLLGTTRRRDGSRQVTYDGHPLYFYAHEGKNEVLCHDVAEFGGTWLVLTPDGRPAPA
jgi:predicted lipoprotein with Yx(FWY)xxD motif